MTWFEYIVLEAEDSEEGAEPRGLDEEGKWLEVTDDDNVDEL